MATSKAHETYLETKIFGCLNGMRCFSIIYVIWHHCTSNAQFSYFPMLRRGFLGVDMFFIISGFLIVTLLLRERQKTEAISLSKFYVRRFLRIFPVYYALLLAISLVLIFIVPGANLREPFFMDLPYYALYVSNWHHNLTFMGISWSLATEEQFYLCWPPIQKYLPKSALAILLAFLAINQFVNFGFLSTILGDRAAYFQSLDIVQCTYTPICLGVLLAYLLNSPSNFHMCYTLLGKRLGPLWALLGFLTAVNLPGQDIQGFVRLAIQFFAAALIASVVVREDNIFRKLLSSFFINRIGVVSYGMYLFHLIVMMAIKKVLATTGSFSEITLFFWTLLFTYLLCEMSYRYFETPFLRMKKLFESK